MTRTHYFGEHSGWKARKKQYGIPDKVCKFSLGAKLDDYNKAIDTLGDFEYKKEYDTMEVFYGFLKTYEAELTKLKPEKFKGKTPTEQAKNKADALKDLDIRRKAFKAKMEFVMSHVEPIAHLLKHYAAVVAKYKSLDPKDANAVAGFNGQEIRNTLGLSVGAARKMKLGQKVLDAMAEYEKWAENANEVLIGDKKPLNPNVQPQQTAYAHIGKALEALKPYLK